MKIWGWCPFVGILAFDAFGGWLVCCGTAVGRSSPEPLGRLAGRCRCQGRFLDRGAAPRWGENQGDSRIFFGAAKLICAEKKSCHPLIFTPFPRRPCQKTTLAAGGNMQENHHKGSNKDEIAQRLQLAQAELLVAEAECDALEEGLEAAIKRYNLLEQLIEALEDELDEEPP